MAYSNKRYGKARYIGGARVVREFADAPSAYRWHERVTKGWRRVFVTDAMVYADKECTRKCLEGFDMLAMRCDTEDYGFHIALENARELKYGYPIPGIFERVERCEDTTE